MKRLFVFFAPLIFLIACESLFDSNDSISSFGEIKKIEVSTWQYGTHTLNDSEGKPLYALKSSSINLGLYEDKVVKILGKKIDGYPVDGGPDYAEVTTIEILN
jgi:hypothetical protein